MLKDLKGISDEEVCLGWRESPYFQHFCGEVYFQHRLPVEPPSLSIFRKRIGKAGLERLLPETIRIGLKAGVVTKSDLKTVNIDSAGDGNAGGITPSRAVQEKAIRFPTDMQLCHKPVLSFAEGARTELVKSAQAQGIKLRQSYARKSKQALFMANKYFAATQAKRGHKMAQEVRNYLGRVMRDIERAIARNPGLADRFKDDLAKAGKIFAQAINRHEPDKIFSWHAPEVECIAKPVLSACLAGSRRGQDAQEI